MKSLKERIIEFNKGHKEEEELFKSPMEIAFSIAIYAHREELRENGEYYINHPYRVATIFHDAISVDDKLISRELADTIGIPSAGAFEVAILHDVVEDTEITHQEIKDLFKELGYETGFNNFIDEPLKLLTHDKSEPYDVYIKKVMQHPTSALIKMCDMTDNLNMFGLVNMDDKVLERSIKYIGYIKQINDKYHFLKKLDIARRYFKEEILDKANEKDPSDN